MPDPNAIATPFAAFVAGLVTSVHCTAMCGPLTCAAFGRARTAWTPLLYHLTRLLSYALAGGILGMAGRHAAGLFSTAPARALPWAFALLFLAFAFRLDKWLPQPKALSALLFRFRLATMRPGTVAAVLGFFTPLFPCGPLYLVLGVAILAGSFAAGALMMVAFALGTIPLLFLLQTQFARLPFSPAALERTRQGLALLSAALLVWRAVAGASGLSAPMHCPACHP